MHCKNLALLFVLVFTGLISFSQNTPAATAVTPPKVAVYDGTIVVGYVDHGGYLTLTGPNINWTYGRTKVLLGLLPSLRFKEDKSPVKNSFVTPSVGLGLTFYHKRIAIQLPIYYVPKTSTKNGYWAPGIGVGFRLK